MARALIAVCPQYDPEHDFLRIASPYMEAVSNAGGIPILLPFETKREVLNTFVSAFGGLLVPGGPDLDPEYFGEETCRENGVICKQRDQLELALIPLFIEAGKPVLGICRGLQSMNIALGGDIYQDIPSMTDSRLQHSQISPGNQPVHTVQVVANSLLSRILKTETLRVNSFHHQAVRRAAPSFLPGAFSKDGLIEGQYMPDKPFVLGVQWHPELLGGESSRLLFSAFVAACKQTAC